MVTRRGPDPIHGIGTIEMPTSLLNGTKTVTASGTPEALAASADVYGWVFIVADPGNSGTNVYVCDASNDKDSGGIPLAVGDPPFPVMVADISTIYVDVDTNGDAVRYFGS